MRMRGVTLILFSILALAAAGVVIAGAQARIGGIVTDSNGNPLPDAVITITSDEVSSYHKEIKVGKDGKFKALILDATRVYLMHVEAPGYQPAERELDVPAGSTDSFFEFVLKSHEELVVSQKQSIREQPGYKEYEEGRNLLAAGKNEEARAKFAAAVEAMPDLIPALASLAELDHQAGRYEEALATARKCLEEDEEVIDCLAIAANACQSLGASLPVRSSFSCDTLAASAKEKGIFLHESMIEDKAQIRQGSFFLNRRTPTDWVHAGIVIRPENEVFQTIEGNTNDEGSREGYEVCKRIRGYRKKDFILI